MSPSAVAWFAPLLLLSLCNAQQAAIVGSFGLYPGYTGNLSMVSGVMSVSSDSGVQTLSWSLSNVDPRCAKACTAANCCGVHIHVGTDCADANTIGGHWYDTATLSTDPWASIMYNASSSPSTESKLEVVTGLDAADILGRAMVIHNYDGGRIACGLIEEASVDSFSTYPGYTGNLESMGSAYVSSGNGKQTLSWIFESGLDTRCNETCTAANCCGVHIHVGTDCADANTIAGHWYDTATLSTDPWASIMYNTSDGMPSVASGVEVETYLDTAQVNGRTLVIHDFNGARIACGKITLPVSEAIVSGFSLYPGSNSNLTVDGAMSVISSEDDMGTQTLSWDLTGLDPQCAKTCTAANCCGVHIHVGTDCSDASTIGGHYWDSNDYSTDPWLVVMYNSTLNGTSAQSGVAVATGRSASEVLLRAMVIHDFNGARIACGIINVANVPTFAPYPTYAGNLMTAGVMSVKAVGTTQTLSWVLTAGLDTQCNGTCTAPNCCGVHIHAGMDCSDADTIGGHWYDSATLSTDPWASIMYDASTMPSVKKDVVVETGKTPEEVEGRTMVIHDFSGARIACGTITLGAPTTTTTTETLDVSFAVSSATLTSLGASLLALLATR